MIQLTRLNGDVFTLNAMLIEQVQTLPDTTITLVNGKKMVVKEPEETVVELTTSFYKKIGIQHMIREVGDQSE